MTASTAEVETGSAAPAAASTRWVWRAVQLGVVLLPAAMILVAGWQRRWLNEDAFINLRIVDQIFGGHGPVFNAGERVEAYTSPLWLAALVGVRATLGQLIEVEWATVVAGLAASVAAFAVGAVASRRLFADGDVTVPIGLLAVAAIPVVWDFSTSGLEVGITWLWLAVAWALLLRAGSAVPELTPRANWVGLVVMGLGPMVRPDLGLVSICLIAAWIVIARHRGGRAVGDVAIAFAVPVAYQVFRMGYFASLVPSTALAKDAGGLHLRQGLDYAGDLIGTYWLWIPLACAAVAIFANLRRDRWIAVATVAMVGGGLLHAAYFVVIGGDYMHGRLLLPALFAVALPASVGVRKVTAKSAALVGVVAVWAIVCATTLRFAQPPGSLFTVVPISDWRILSDAIVTPHEKPNPNFISGTQIHELYERGGRGFIPITEWDPLPGRDPDRLAVSLGSIGIPAYNAGRDVFVVDLAGLAEPLAARTDVVPGRAAGHRKQVDDAWYVARFAEDASGNKEAAARRALSCAPLADLLRAIDSPLTPGRFMSNLWNSFAYTRLHIPADPVEAERELCGRDGS